VWKDASGAIVSVVGMATRSGVLFTDSSAVVWSYNFMSDFVSAALDHTITSYYTTANCTGTAYVSRSVPTRYTFFGGQAYQYRPDGVPSLLIASQSRLSDGLCQAVGENVWVILASNLVNVIEPPEFPWVKPIHVEYVP
jgi:hypothetical protein